MRIIFDARMSEHSGIGTYISHLLPFFISDSEFQIEIICRPQQNINKFVGAKKIHFLDSDIYTINEQILLYLFLSKQKDDFTFWSPHINIPLGYKGPLISTVHDLIFFEKQLYDSNFLKKAYANIFFSSLSKKAQIIFTPSSFTAQELIRQFPKAKNKVTVTPLAAGENWKPQVESTKKKQIVYVGNFKKNKNVHLLISAFSQIADQIPHQLILIGAYDQLRTYEKIDISEALKNRIKILGKIDFPSLQKNVRESELMVCPSSYEGFSLPPHEALAVGTPVLCSDIPPHLEFLEKTAHFF